MKILLSVFVFLGLCQAQSFVAVTAVSQDAITTTIPIDNRSLIIRHSSVHTFCATGTGSWSAQIQYADAAVTGPWTSFPDGFALVNNGSASCVGVAIGYHNYIRFLLTGTVTVNYRGLKDAYIPSSAASVVSVPFGGITGGTNLNTLTIGSAGVLTFSSGGFINANRINGVTLSALGTGLLKNTTTTGAPSIAAGGTDYEFPLTVSSPICRATNALSVCANSITLSQISGGILSGNGSKLGTVSGTLTSGDTAQLDASGNIIASGLQIANIIRSTTTYADPSWITSLSASKLSGGTVPNGVLGANVVRTDQTNTYSTGTQDASAALHTLPIKTGLLASIPATCTVGETYFVTNATAGQNLFGCTSANTWTLQSGFVLGADVVKTSQGNTYSTGTQDFRTALHTLSMRSGILASIPATCTVSESYFATDAAAGLNLYGCTATNTWTLQSGSGSPSLIVPVSFSATPTFTCPNTIASTISFQVGALTANITSSTLAGCGAGQSLNFTFTEDGTGGWTVAMPTGFAQACQVNPLATQQTTMSFYWDGTFAKKTGCGTDGGVLVFASEQAAPTGAPPSGTVWCWPDSTDHAALECMANGSTNRFRMLNTPASAKVIGTDANRQPTVATAGDISSLGYASGGGTAQAQTVTLSPAVGSLTANLTVCWLPNAANTGPGATLAVNGLTATTITKLGTTGLSANDITTTAVACAKFITPNFQLQNPQTGSSGGGLFFIPLPIGGANPFGTGFSSPQWNNATGGIILSGFSEINRMDNSDNSGTSTRMTRAFRWPANWNFSNPTNFRFTLAQGGVSGNMKWDVSFSCVSTNPYSPLSYTAGGTTGSIAVPALNTTTDYTISALITTGCTAGKFAVIQLGRDNTIGSNAVGSISFLDASLEQ